LMPMARSPSKRTSCATLARCPTRLLARCE
jgi:hypothetical protein